MVQLTPVDVILNALMKSASERGQGQIMPMIPPSGPSAAIDYFKSLGVRFVQIVDPLANLQGAGLDMLYIDLRNGKFVYLPMDQHKAIQNANALVPGTVMKLPVTGIKMILAAAGGTDYNKIGNTPEQQEVIRQRIERDLNYNPDYVRKWSITDEIIKSLLDWPGAADFGEFPYRPDDRGPSRSVPQLEMIRDPVTGRFSVPQGGQLVPYTGDLDVRVSQSDMRAVLTAIARASRIPLQFLEFLIKMRARAMNDLIQAGLDDKHLGEALMQYFNTAQWVRGDCLTGLPARWYFDNLNIAAGVMFCGQNACDLLAQPSQPVGAFPAFKIVGLADCAELPFDYRVREIWTRVSGTGPLHGYWQGPVKTWVNVDPWTRPIAQPVKEASVPWRMLPYLGRPLRFRIPTERSEVGYATQPRPMPGGIQFGPGLPATPVLPQEGFPKFPPIQTKVVKLRTQWNVWLGRKPIQLLNALTEYCDFIEALYMALPKQYRTHVPGQQLPGGARQKVPARLTPGCAEMGAIVYRHADKIQVPRALANVAKEQMMDYIYGRAGQLAAKAGIALKMERGASIAR